MLGFSGPAGAPLEVVQPAARVQPGRELALRRGYICHREFAARTPISAELWPEPQDLAGAEQLKTAPNRCFLTRLAQNCCRARDRNCGFDAGEGRF